MFRSFGELLQARLPQGSAPDSENHLATLLGDDVQGRDYVIEQSYNHTLSIRDKEWKYIEPSDGPAGVPWVPAIESGNSKEPQLYHLSKDRAEKKNVIDKNGQKAQELKAKLQAVREGQMQQ